MLLPGEHNFHHICGSRHSGGCVPTRHPERKQIDVRSLKCITYDALEADLIGVIIDRECADVNIVVRQYDASLSSLLDKHAPSKRIYVVDRPMKDWMTDDILVLKALRRKYESLWRKTRLTVHFDMYSESIVWL